MLFEKYSRVYCWNIRFQVRPSQKQPPDWYFVKLTFLTIRLAIPVLLTPHIGAWRWHNKVQSKCTVGVAAVDSRKPCNIDNVRG